MIPTIQEPVQCYITTGPKTIRRPRLRWHPDSVIIAVQAPRRIDDLDNKVVTRRYARIQFKYYDGASKHIKSKTIFFGDPDGQFVGDHDLTKRALRYQKLAHQTDPFHPNYWRLHMLNNTQSMETNYVQFVRKLVSLNQKPPQKKRIVTKTPPQSTTVAPPNKQ